MRKVEMKRVLFTTDMIFYIDNPDERSQRNLNKWRDIAVVMGWETQHWKDVILYKLTYCAIPIKITARNVVDINKIILKFMRKDKGTRIAIPFLSIYSTPVNVLQHNSDTSYAELDPTNERSGSSTRCFHFRCWLQVGSWDTCTADQLATN